MAQEFTIKSQQIENKINQLLPSQGGFAPGVDFSASTMVIPIVDLTETAEGSSLRQDLQTSLSLTTVTSFDVSNTTTTLINTTGYFRVYGQFNVAYGSVSTTSKFTLTDGFTSKVILDNIGRSTSNFHAIPSLFYDFIVKLEAGESLTASTDQVVARMTGTTRQIADINGNLINP